MKFRRLFGSKTKAPACAVPASAIEQAAKPVMEYLEERLLLASHHYVRPITSLFSGATIRQNGGAGPGGYTPAQIRHLYGLDALDAPDPNFPLYINKGQEQ